MVDNSSSRFYWFHKLYSEFTMFAMRFFLIPFSNQYLSKSLWCWILHLYLARNHLLSIDILCISYISGFGKFPVEYCSK